MSRQKAIFRCDASPSIGAGHVTRCLALAEALSEAGWEVGFVVGADTASTLPALMATDFKVRALAGGECELKAMRSQGSDEADLVVIDHYQRDRQFECACRTFGRKILVFDDFSGRAHDCDVLVDAAADAARYAHYVPMHAAILAGPAYAVMRKPFTLCRDKSLARRDGRPVKSILVSCGATDPINCTGAALDALDAIGDDVEVTIVLSSLAPHLDAVRRRLHGTMRLVLDPEADRMAALMTDADLAIGAPGATTYERAVLGLPSIIITFANNQRAIARMMVGAGATADAGEIVGGITDPDGLATRLKLLLKGALECGEMRKRMSLAASALIDGRGGLRIMLGLDSERDKEGSIVTLRLAAEADETWLLWLQSLPQTRHYFRNREIPTPAEHRAWLQRTLSNACKILLIVEVDHEPAGMVRLDGPANTNGVKSFEISIAVDPARHGRGIGSAALRLVRKLMPSAIFDAIVQVHNTASKALFRTAGFSELTAELHRSVPA